MVEDLYSSSPESSLNYGRYGGSTPAPVPVPLQSTHTSEYRYCIKRSISTQTDPVAKVTKKRRLAIGTKVERCDKYWFRAFRAFINLQLTELMPVLMAEDPTFWSWYLGKEGKPETSSQFVSYNRAFREFLLKSCSFGLRFKFWMQEKGVQDLIKKHGDSAFGNTLKEYGERLLELAERERSE